jgi:adenylate cyclase
MGEIVTWLENNAVLLGAIGSLAAVFALFLVNGAQVVSALIRRVGQSSVGSGPAPETLSDGADASAPPSVDVSQPVPGFGGRDALAVLPFENMSEDAEQGYFADGITEDLLTALQAGRTFPVIARSTTFAYKGTSPDIRQVAKDLGAGYVLEGSVRKMGERVRITAQLIDSAGVHLWAERYDRNIAEIFDVQDEIIEQIAAAIDPELLRADRKKQEHKKPEDLKAWDYTLQAGERLLSPVIEDFSKSLELLQKALALDPSFGLAHAMIANAYSYNIVFFGGKAFKGLPEDSMDLALRHANTAVALDKNQALAHRVLGLVLLRFGDMEGGLHECQEAVRLNPSGSLNHHSLSIVLAASGRYQESLEEIEIAKRLSPQDFFLWNFYQIEGWAAFCLGQYERVVGAARHGLRLRPENKYAHLQLIAALDSLERFDEARDALQDLQNKIPNFGVKELLLATSVKDQYLAALERAGWVEPPG